MDCKELIKSQSAGDFIIEYNGNRELLKEYFPEDCITFYNSRFSCVYRELKEPPRKLLSNTGYSYIPKCYTPMGEASMEEAGIRKVNTFSGLSYTGKGCLIAVIDDGIDYLNPIFRNRFGKSRIAYYWDQTVDDETHQMKDFPYGAVYTGEELISGRTSVERKNSTHGTFLAGIVAGNGGAVERQEETGDGGAARLTEDNANLTGACKDATLLIVRLKKAKDYLKDLFGLSGEAVYQENDIMAGVAFSIKMANSLQMPVSILIGVGSVSGDHSGLCALDQMIDMYERNRGIAIVAPAGNEGIKKKHYHGFLNQDKRKEEVLFQMGNDEKNVVMELWAKKPGAVAVGFETPRGQRIEKILPRFIGSSENRFVLESSVITVDYQLVEEQTGKELVYIRLEDAIPGLWKIFVYLQENEENVYDIWLSDGSVLKTDTYFLDASIYDTVTSPGTANGAITVAAYNGEENTLYLPSSRGEEDVHVKPDLAAPGDQVIGTGNYIETLNTIDEKMLSGTSVAAAHVAGAAALLFEWSMKDAKEATLNGQQIKRLLIRGADRSRNQLYPNAEWGYGTLDLYQVFVSLDLYF